MRQRNEQGFSLIEVILTFAILAVATTALGLVEVSNTRRSMEIKARDVAFSQAQTFLERLQQMPFGSDTAPAATAADYENLFGSDGDVRSVSLTQFEQRDTDGDGIVDDAPIRFRLSGVADKGLWEIYIDNDLDGNGLIEPTIDGVPTREGRSDILRIEIKHDGRTILKTIRARTPQEQEAQA